MKMLLAVILFGVQASANCPEVKAMFNLKTVTFTTHMINGDYTINVDLPNLANADCDATDPTYIEFKKLDPPMKITIKDQSTGKTTQKDEATSLIISDNSYERTLELGQSSRVLLSGQVGQTMQNGSWTDYQSFSMGGMTISSETIRVSRWP
jgi:hypothetical protein